MHLTHYMLIQVNNCFTILKNVSSLFLDEGSFFLMYKCSLILQLRNSIERKLIKVNYN